MQNERTSTARADAALSSCRSRLDTCDARLLACLRERFAIIAEVAAIKHREGIPVMQPDRVNTVVARARAFAEENGLSPDVLEQIYRILIAEACRIETSLMPDGADERISQREGRQK